MARALVTCPWCDWSVEVRRGTLDEVIAAGQAAAADHVETVGHPVKPGARARVGYRRGRPVDRFGRPVN